MIFRHIPQTWVPIGSICFTLDYLLCVCLSHLSLTWTYGVSVVSVKRNQLRVHEDICNRICISLLWSLENNKLLFYSLDSSGNSSSTCASYSPRGDSCCIRYSLWFIYGGFSIQLSPFSTISLWGENISACLVASIRRQFVCYIRFQHFIRLIGDLSENRYILSLSISVSFLLSLSLFERVLNLIILNYRKCGALTR